jgi:multidrug resistance efflux pump
MATATAKTKKTTNTIDALRDAASAKWRAWAQALASGGALPPTGELLEAAGVLGRDIDDLERDAEYLRAYAAEVQTRDNAKAALDKVEAERGPIEEINAAIEQLENDLEAMRQRLGWGALEGFAYGRAKATIERLRKQRPDLFDGAA